MAFQTKFTIYKQDWDADSRKLPAKITDYTYTLTEKVARTFDVAATTEVVVWDPVNVPSEQVTAFQYIWFLGDQEFDVEWVVNTGDANLVTQTQRVPAGMPFLLPSNVAFDGNGGVGLSGTQDVIDQVSVKAGATAAKIQVEIGA